MRNASVVTIKSHFALRTSDFELAARVGLALAGFGLDELRISYSASRATDMKQCLYCGKEYPDSETQCAIDGHALAGDKRVHAARTGNKIKADSKEAALSAVASSTYLKYPEYIWKARDAWKCLGVLLLISVLPAVINHFAHLVTRWRATALGIFTFELVVYSACLVTAAYFARTQSWETFRTAFGLNAKPSERVWFGVLAALSIRILGHVLRINRLGGGRPDSDLVKFSYQFGWDRYLYLVPPVFFAPFFEELINRGFLYRAFRGSYPAWLSIFLIAAWTAFNHSGQFAFWIAALDLTLLTVLQCYLREKSNSIWDCVICHFVFNASLLFMGLRL